MDSASTKFIAFDGWSRAREILQEGNARARKKARRSSGGRRTPVPSRRWTTIAGRIREDTDDFPGGRVSSSSYSVVSVVLSPDTISSRFPRPYPLERILYLRRRGRYSLVPPTLLFVLPLAPLSPSTRFHQGAGIALFQYRGNERDKSRRLRSPRKADGGSRPESARTVRLHIINTRRTTFRPERCSNISADTRTRRRLGADAEARAAFSRRPVREVSSWYARCFRRGTASGGDTRLCDAISLAPPASKPDKRLLRVAPLPLPLPLT